MKKERHQVLKELSTYILYPMNISFRNEEEIKTFSDKGKLKDWYAGKDWRQEEKGMAEDEMVGWHHQLNAHEFEQAPGDGKEQGSLVCCNPWGHKELDTTKWLKNEKKLSPVDLKND